MYKKINIQPLKGDKYLLTKRLEYKDIVVPQWYVTNGANVPRIFWSFFPPNRPDYLPAVIVHDYLCDKGEYKKADDYFEEIMRELKIGKVTIFSMVAGVRMYHYFKLKLRLNN